MNPDTKPTQPTSLTTRPSYIHGGTKRYCDGVNDDLLTAGMGKDRLAFGTPPAIVDPLNPTVDELPRLAIYTNYRALVDTSAGGGYGVLYGPDIGTDGKPIGGAGRVAGDEYLAFAVDGKDHHNVTLMVQIPTDFDWENPCIVTAPSSGSRGIYAAIGTVAKINQYGILREQNLVQPVYWASSIPQSIAVTFVQAYGRLSVNDPICGYSFGATIPAGQANAGTPTSADPAASARFISALLGFFGTPLVSY